MENNKKKTPRNFSVVKFLKLPFNGIDDYLCVPYKWVIIRATDQKAVVTYPNNENPLETRDRAKRMERYSDEWRGYSAEIKHETDNYEDAEYWIAMRKNYEALLQENSSINGTQPMPTVESRNSNRNHSSKSEITEEPHQIPRKPLPTFTNKRPASEEPKQKLNTKRTKLMSIEAARAKGGLIPNRNAEPGSSRTEQSITIRNNQLMESALTKETTAATKGEKSTEQVTQSINHKIYKRSRQEPNMPILNEDGPTEVIKKPPTTVGQTPQPNQHDNQKHLQDSGSSSSDFRPRISDVRSMATTFNNQEQRTDDSDDVSINLPSTSQHIPKSLSIAGNLYSKMKGKPSLTPLHPPIEKKMRLEYVTRNVAIALQNRSTLMDETESLSEPPAIEPPVTRIQNQSFSDVPVDSQEIQHVARINIEGLQNVAAVKTKAVRQSTNNVALASQTPSNTPQRPSFSRRLNGQQNLPHLQQHMQQATGGKDLPQRPSGSNFDQSKNATQHQPNRPDSPTIRIPSLNRSPGGSRNGDLERPYQAQQILNQQELRRPPRDPRRPAGIPHIPSVEEFREERHLSEVPRSISEALSTTRNNYLSNEQRRQVLMNENPKLLGTAGLDHVIRNIRGPEPRDMLSSKMPTGSSYQPPRRGPPSIYENKVHNQRMHNQLVNRPNARNLTTSQVYPQDDIARSTAAKYSSRGVNIAGHTDVYMEEEPLSPNCGANADSVSDTDQEAAFGHEILTDESLVETTHEVDGTEHDFVDRSTSVEQQMLNQFATLITQMGSTLNSTANKFNHLRDSIIKTANTYQKLLDNIERFNAMASSAGHVSSSRSVRQEVPPVVEERPAAAVEGNAGNGDQPSNDAVNRAPERNHNNKRRFVLPPEYDPEDTKWTLKYREPMGGLVELLPRSGIYVSHAKLENIMKVSNNCQSLAQRLLVEVFNKKALSVCSSMTEKSKIGYKMRPDARPDLDDHGCLILLNFVLEHGRKRGWNTNRLSIVQGLHDTVKELRYNFGVNNG